MNPNPKPSSQEVAASIYDYQNLRDEIRVIHVEDSKDDALLVERQVTVGGIKAQIQRVESAPEFRRLLLSQDWDLIFVDCMLPAFSASEALSIKEELELDIPVIIITGSIDEEVAVEYMLAGVEDIIIKDRWSRLVPAIRRTIASAQRKREKERAERELLISHNRIKRQVEQLNALRLIDSSIKGSFDLRITLDVILDQIVSVLGVSAAAILLADPETRILSYAGTRGLPRSVYEKCQSHAAGHASILQREIRIHDLNAESLGTEVHPVLNECVFRAFFSLPLDSKGETLGVLEVFNEEPVSVNEDWIQFLETLVGQASIAISDARMFERLQRTNHELSAAYDETIEGWARALDLRDKETEGHSRRVTEMTVTLALKKGFSGRDLTMIRWGALLHDIGKMGIPDHILLKPGPLSADEWEIMKRHPAYAKDLLRPIHFLRDALDIPFCHHEKWDGSGYPQGLKGEQIPLSARLFAVVDVWDALSFDRPYRSKWPLEKIKAHLVELAGSHFDPEVVNLFLG